MTHLILAVALRSAHLSGPKVDAKCYQSVFNLGTDNVPVGNGLSTSVVNIWAFNDRTGRSVAWLYKNNSGKYYLQISKVVDPRIASSLGINSKFLKRPIPGGNYTPIRVSTSDIRTPRARST